MDNLDLDKISPKLVGNKVILGPVREDLNDTFRRWLHDPETGFMLRPNALISHKEEEEWFEQHRKAGTINFTIYDKAAGTAIGSCGFMDLDRINQCAEFGIFIGEKKFRNKGLGTEATILTVDYGFNVLNFASVFLRVHEWNRLAIHVYEKAGFKVIGRRRKGCFLGGKFYDDIYMDIIREDFNQSYINKWLAEIEKEIS